MAWNRKKNKNKNSQAAQATQVTQTSPAPRRPRLFGDPGWRDRPFVKRTISLNTPEAKSLGNSIPSVAGAACIIGFALQRYFEDIRVLALLEAVDEEIFKTLGKDLENECARLETLIAEEGVQKSQNLFPHPTTVTVEITHPYGVEYAKMVENMDRLVLMLWDLHSARIINSLKLTKEKAKWYELIRDGGKRITSLAYDKLDEARQEKALQDQKEAGDGKGDETTTAAASALPESQSTGAPDTTAAPEAAKPQEVVPGGNGGRKSTRKAATTAAHAPGTEELTSEVSPEASALAAAEESPPPLEQAV